MRKRIFGILLTLCMLFTLIPMTAMATDGVTVYNEGELRDAVEARVSPITLGDHIVLTEPLILQRGNGPEKYYELTLNMNKHTLKGDTVKLIACDLTVNGTLDANVQANRYVDTSNSIPSFIRAGTYNGSVELNNSAIYGGTFLNKVSGAGEISGGTFNKPVSCASVLGGTFLDECTVTEFIHSGIFYGSHTQDKMAPNAYAVVYNDNGKTYAIEYLDEYAWRNKEFSGVMDPNKDGYNFLGWYKDGDSNKVTFPYRFPPSDFSDRKLTLYAQWKDVTAPVISGVANGGSYCPEQIVTVTDNEAIASVTVNGTAVDLENGQFKLSPSGEKTIVATDEAGNPAQITVTVYDNHIDDNKDHKCDRCEKTLSDCADDNKDHKCDICGKTLSECADGNKDHKCDVCGKTLSQHEGGTATCTKKAICTHCSKEYGEIDSTNHNIEHVAAKVATAAETGHGEYWQCKDCGKCFSNETGSTEIQPESVIIAKLAPTMVEGTGQKVTVGQKIDLTFRSNAAYSDFKEVTIDGKTLDTKNYTKQEGSIIVTLKADYVAKLSAGTHTVGIVSESGTASTTLTVSKVPNTGDNSPVVLWTTLLFVSIGALTATGIYGKKKKGSVKG